MPISDRSLSAPVAHRHGHLSVIVPCAPTGDASDADRNTFYDQLGSLIRNLLAHDRSIVAGGMNAITGNDRLDLNKSLVFLMVALKTIQTEF